MTDKINQITEVLEIVRKGNGLRAARDLAHKRHDLNESEFKVLFGKDNPTSVELESARASLIESYSAYLDACLALRQFSASAEAKVESFIEENKK